MWSHFLEAAQLLLVELFNGKIIPLRALRQEQDKNKAVCGFMLILKLLSAGKYFQREIAVKKILNLSILSRFSIMKFNFSLKTLNLGFL